jgi:hypothetical protein
MWRVYINQCLRQEKHRRFSTNTTAQRSLLNPGKARPSFQLLSLSTAVYLQYNTMIDAALVTLNLNGSDAAVFSCLTVSKLEIDGLRLRHVFRCKVFLKFSKMQSQKYFASSLLPHRTAISFFFEGRTWCHDFSKLWHPNDLLTLKKRTQDNSPE